MIMQKPLSSLSLAFICLKYHVILNDTHKESFTEILLLVYNSSRIRNNMKIFKLLKLNELIIIRKVNLSNSITVALQHNILPGCGSFS